MASLPVPQTFAPTVNFVSIMDLLTIFGSFIRTFWLILYNFFYSFLHAFAFSSRFAISTSKSFFLCEEFYHFFINTHLTPLQQTRKPHIFKPSNSGCLVQLKVYLIFLFSFKNFDSNSKLGKVFAISLSNSVHTVEIDTSLSLITNIIKFVPNDAISCQCQDNIIKSSNYC